LAEKHEEIRSLGKFGRRWENNNKTDLRELRCEGVEWIHVTSLEFRGAILSTQQQTFGYHKRRENS